MHSSTEDEMYLNVLFPFGVTSHNHLLSPIPLKSSMSKPEHCGVLPMFGLGCQARAHGAPHPCVLTREFGEVPTLRLEGVSQAHKDTLHALKDWARVLHRILWVLVFIYINETNGGFEYVVCSHLDLQSNTVSTVLR
ncbi:hypothetical protein Peur_038902 [Populus x canadensis]